MKAIRERECDNADRVKKHFKLASTNWGRRYEGVPRKMSDLDLRLRRKNFHRLVRPFIEVSDATVRILDIGCGAGNVLDGLPRSHVEVFGVDRVPEMVADAARRNPLDRFAVAEAARLPLESECVDIVTCAGVLEYVSDPRAVLSELRRMLVPKGHLVISFPNKSSWFRSLSNLEILAERLLLRCLDAACGRNREHASTAYEHSQWTVRQVQTLLESAGFDVHDMAFNTYGLWGMIGRTSVALRTSRWMSERFRRRSMISSRLACTMVVLASKR